MLSECFQHSVHAAASQPGVQCLQQLRCLVANLTTCVVSTIPTILSLACAVILTGASALSKTGGGERDRTDDLLLAKQALSQLSYTPNLLTQH